MASADLAGEACHCGISVILLGTNSRPSFGQPEVTGRRGAGASLGWRGFKLQTKAPSNTRITNMRMTVLHSVRPGPGPRALPMTFASVDGNLVEDIGVHPLQRNAAFHHFDRQRQRDTRGWQAGMIVAGLV
jgi:hypothetical protein